MLPQLSLISDRCTSYFGDSDPGRSDFFVSQMSEVYAFGSNSSSQLAMRSSDKFHAATPMPHMDAAQMVNTEYCLLLLLLLLLLLFLVSTKDISLILEATFQGW